MTSNLDPQPTAPPTAAPASECICEDVRILGACPVHDPPTTDIASDALVAAWRYDLHRISDNERQETPVKEIRQLMNRIGADRAEIDRLRARVAELEEVLKAAIGHCDCLDYNGKALIPCTESNPCVGCSMAAQIRATLKPEPASR